ncbi:type II secretion system protein [Vibrio rotiferianus]|uniref:type II secretion system protein n=1 Tax=Vibrio rotiferianus TaxID=190895 RepID=UPI0003A77D23|nr:type II secretion system protein [Vibrio rotiferianus]PIB18041.1 hypothetical protein B853_00913 [Vibrio rotiferianus CAIM 577 = LMG 21460]
MPPLRSSSLKLGFTLIELLVVISLMAMVTTIVVPSLWGQYQHFQQRSKVESFWYQVVDKADASRQSGHNFILDTSSPEWIQAAEEQGLELHPSRPILIRADGFVQSGDVLLTVQSVQRNWRISIAMPDGKVTIKPDSR